LRGRLVIIGTAGVAVALAVGGVALVVALRVAVLRAVEDSATTTARSMAELAVANQLPDPISTGGTAVVQVLGPDGAIRAASIGADRLIPVLHPDELDAARRGSIIRVAGSRVGQDGPVLVAAARAGQDTVIAAVPAWDAERSVTLLRTALLVAYPPLLAVLAALAWRVVGAALRPVEALRRGAEEIAGTADPPGREGAGAGGVPSRAGAGEVPGREGPGVGGVSGREGAGARGGRAWRLPVPDARDEVQRLAVTLNDMLDRIEAGRRRQRAFVADAAHELRSPLTSLRTQIEIAQHLGEPAEAADLLPDVQRLSRLVDDLLVLARADEGDPGLRRTERVELAALARELAGRYERVAVVPSGPHETLGDPVALDRVLGNLVDNAVRHTRTGVTVRVARDGPDVLVTVTDDGPGIPAADRERVFDRFTRLDDARDRDGGGTGLGLAIVHDLVRLHGGTVRLADADPGLRAEVRLPAAPPP